MTVLNQTICPWCGGMTPMDYVHGHAQCIHCKTNIAPCCDGAQVCDGAAEASAVSKIEG